jgi:transcription elongation GreA/GreB family factor
MKAELLNHCLSLAGGKVEALERELQSMKIAIQSESKSTAGDKHETGRAMIHLEQEKLHQQLAEAKLVLAELQQIDSELSNEKVGLGSLVKTNKGTFYLAASLGKVELDGVDYFVVSAKAPIAKQFLGKQAGETANMNGMVYDILAVE